MGSLLFSTEGAGFFTDFGDEKRTFFA